MSNFKRSRSNDGTPNKAEALLPIPKDVLRRLLIIFTSEPYERRAPRTFHGPNVMRGAPKSFISETQVLALRQMHEWYGMNSAQIASATGLLVNTVENIIKYKNRLDIEPGPKPQEEA